MELKLKWHKPKRLTDASKDNGIYGINLGDIPERTGIYIFYREYGAVREALYVGKASNLKSRIKQQLNNVKLMKGIENASKGYRRIVYAEFIAKRGQQEDKCIALIERALIRYYLALEDNILNKQGTRIRSDIIVSHRSSVKRFIPEKIHHHK